MSLFPIHEQLLTEVLQTGRFQLCWWQPKSWPSNTVLNSPLNSAEHTLPSFYSHLLTCRDVSGIINRIKWAQGDFRAAFLSDTPAQAPLWTADPRATTTTLPCRHAQASLHPQAKTTSFQSMGVHSLSDREDTAVVAYKGPPDLACSVFNSKIDFLKAHCPQTQ